MATHSSIVAGEFQRQKNLASCSPQDHKESDTTERLTLSLSLSFMLEEPLNFLAGHMTAHNFKNTSFMLPLSLVFNLVSTL